MRPEKQSLSCNKQCGRFGEVHEWDVDVVEETQSYCEESEIEGTSNQCCIPTPYSILIRRFDFSEDDLRGERSEDDQSKDSCTVLGHIAMFYVQRTFVPVKSITIPYFSCPDLRKVKYAEAQPDVV